MGGIIKILYRVHSKKTVKIYNKKMQENYDSHKKIRTAVLSKTLALKGIDLVDCIIVYR